jgi:alpha-glucosidase (family GH31 glycosyl hydrolase)
MTVCVREQTISAPALAAGADRASKQEKRVDMRHDAHHRIIINTTARFSCLSDGLVRMEYDPQGIFEDRRSIRALYRPDPVPFTGHSISDGAAILETPACRIRYVPDAGPFSAANLSVVKTGSGEPVWRPGQVDEENLGGVHFSMDVVNRRIIPNGVHPATTEYHDNSGKWMLWNYCGLQHGANVHHLQGMNLEDILATHKWDELTPAMQERIAERSKFPPGILSKRGYFLYNDSTVTLLDKTTQQLTPRKDSACIDWYLFIYGRDFKQALRDCKALFGPMPLLPRFTLGLWYSRYPTFNQKGLEELVEDFAKRDLPLDVLVLDLEWHKRGWHGFDWDTNHIPDPDGLLRSLRDKAIHTTFNAHPNALPTDDSRFEQFIAESGLIDWEKNVYNSHPSYPPQKALFFFDVGDPKQAHAFMDVMHKPVQEQGVDFWWIDGQAPVDNRHNIDDGFVTNHVYFEHINNECLDRRPMIFSRTHGLGGHRYPFHFTGDTLSHWETLESQVEQTLRAGNMGQSYITHDIGGHFTYNTASIIDPELYLRWVQFAVLSPIVRLHSGGGNERRPWMYGKGTLSAFRKAIELRMGLLPYLYTLAWQSARDCVPMCRANYIELPDWEQGYDLWSSYFLGDRIYAAPIVTPSTVRDVLLPPGGWYNGLTGEYIHSTGDRPVKIYGPLNGAPVHFYKAGTVMVKQPYAHRASALPADLVLEVYYSNAGCEDAFTLYEDDGISRDHESGACALTEFRLSEKAGLAITIGPSSGKYRGQPESRAYEIRLFGASCTRLSCNGRIYEGEQVKDGRVYTRFSIEKTDARDTMRIRDA